jgi:hypothetical protein
MKDICLPFPWYFESMKVMGEESTRIMDRGGFYIAHQEGIRSAEERDKIASAIVSAVNNTIGENIRPESVPDLYRSLCGIVDLIDSIYPDTGVIKGSTAYLRAKDIIESAKL